MNYELALKLKKAGFPQDVWKFDLFNLAYNEVGELHLLHEDNDEGGKVGNDYIHREEDEIEWIKCPTLSELIEACGDGFIALHKEYRGDADNIKEIKIKNNSWSAGIPRGWDDSSSWVDTDLPFGNGSTPSEAVAELWLALQGKGIRG